MSASEEKLHTVLGAWRVRGEWFAPPTEIRKQLLEIRDLDLLLTTGHDAPYPPRIEVPPIPPDAPMRGWGIASPRATTFHRWHRRGGKVVSFCGTAELTAENYWRLIGKTVNWTALHCTCDACGSASAAFSHESHTKNR